MKSENIGLRKSLSGFHLWGIAVGLVISGQYFGWSYGWWHAGTLGFLVTTFFISLMYLSFIFSFTELASAIPNAGGSFVYAYKAFGSNLSFVSAFSTLVEFLFAPPAIAMAIGSYLNIRFPVLNPSNVAIFIYIIFMLINFFGVGIAANFELIVTLLAIFELLVFMIILFPEFNINNFIIDGWAGDNVFLEKSTFLGILAAIPSAMWFFLAIEGASMSVEEVKNPQKVIPKAFGLAILTLVFLSFAIMFLAGGVGSWQELSKINDPLPKAMIIALGNSNVWVHMLVWFGLFGLIASFHGIMMGYSRHIFALSRSGFLPKVLSNINYRYKTPHFSILAGGIFGIFIILSDKFITINNNSLTENLVTMSGLGAIVMYIISMLSLLNLRKKDPNLYRPYKTPLYPVLPIVSLILSVICLISFIYFNFVISIIFFFLMIVSYLYFNLKKIF